VVRKATGDARSMIALALGVVAAAWAILTYIPLPFRVPAPALSLLIGLVAVAVGAYAGWKRRWSVVPLLSIALGLVPWALLVLDLVRPR
jgi:hypothetical protein